MKKLENQITQDELKAVLHYEPATGIFTRLVRTSNRIKVGDVAGWGPSRGYRRTRVNGKQYLTHRLAFLYMTGEWPKKHIDHINQIKDDNRWCNLRPCTPSQNYANVGARKNNASGYKGVTKLKNRWCAQISIENTPTHIGLYGDIKDAAKAYNARAVELHGEFAYLNKVD